MTFSILKVGTEGDIKQLLSSFYQKKEKPLKVAKSVVTDSHLSILFTKMQEMEAENRRRTLWNNDSSKVKTGF